MGISGEYWIEQDGSIMYADGDVGNMNHEAHVVNMAQSMISQKLDWKYNQGEYVEWDKFLEDLQKQEYQELLKKYPKQIIDQRIENDQISLINLGLKRLKVDYTLFRVASGQEDERAYAMKIWKWKRVQGDNIETWTFGAKDIQAIAKGIGDILEQEGYEEDENNTFSIYVASTGKSFEFTLAQLENGGRKRPPNPDINRNAQAMNIQFKQREKQGMLPFYQGKLGDCTKYGFKMWLDWIESI